MKKFETKEQAEVSYDNLDRIFKTMMKQYRELECQIGMLQIEIKNLKTINNLQKNQLLELGTKLYFGDGEN